MPTYGDWVTPDPVERSPRWYWWDRPQSAFGDRRHVTEPASAFPQSLGTSDSRIDTPAFVIADPPNYARGLVAFHAHDDVPAGSAGGLAAPAEHMTSTAQSVAEVHIETTTYWVAMPDIEVPPGADIEWEAGGSWVGDSTLTVAWSVHAGYAGGAGSGQGTLCTVPTSGGVVAGTARSNTALWTPLATVADSPYLVSSSPSPIRNRLNQGTGTSAEYALTTSLLDLCLGVRTPEHLTPLTPGSYPLTLPTVDSAFTGPSTWDLYGATTQIDGISIARMFQPPRYRFVYPTTTSVWRLRQRQSFAGSDGPALRQRQNGSATGSWPLRQRQGAT
jgi:hypothetical protein